MAEEQKKEDSAAKQEQPAAENTEEKKPDGEKTAMTADSKIDESAMQNHPGWSIIDNNTLANGIGVRDLQGVMGNAADLKARQHLLNPKKYKTEFKKPNPGKMPNNKDPFPVDLKIEEFECHFPATRIYELDTHVHGQAAAQAAMNVGNNAEKRLVKLENNMATLMRLLFRMGSRVRINCVYYGGQTPFEKYKCIRCLCDDRVSDGQNVQIDQCLYCTRYEPVDGQCYEILNDLGANVAVALDDNQMSYSTIQESVKLGRVEEFRTPLDKAQVDLAQVKIRNKDEVDFDTAWGEGLKMKWAYVPKEDQKTHINWRQSINDDGSGLKRLDSYPGNEANGGFNIVGKDNDSMSNIMKLNKEAMDTYQSSQTDGDKVMGPIKAGKAMEGAKDDVLNFFKGEEYNKVKQLCAGQNVNALLIACTGYASGSNDYNSLISKYKDCASKIGTENPAVVIAAMGTCAEVFTGKLKSGDPDKRSSYGELPRFDMPLKQATTDGKDDKDSGNKKDDSNNTQDAKYAWGDRDKWLWANIADRIAERMPLAGGEQNLDWFPKACYLYCIIAPLLSNSRFDEGDYGFPFFDDQFQKYGMNYSSAYGYRPQFGRMHYGIDIGSEGGAEIHAVHDGTVVEDGTGTSWGDWHGICIDHGDGTYSRYLHCDTMSVKAGQKVSRGDVIGTVGGWGESGPSSYATHLHLEISPGDALGTKSPQDPLDYFPKFKATVSKGDMLTPA